MAMIGAEPLLLGAYVGCLLASVVFSTGQLHLAWLLTAGRRRRSAGQQDLFTGPLPTVTVQLPIYNERYVAERVISAVAALDYPRDRLEIQILDDSTDVTAQITTALVEKLSREGMRITRLHRDRRAGFKAGALAHGLAASDAELVAIFDADFVPAPDFLAVTVPRFADPGIAAVQVRWGHLNEGQSLLTRVQGFLLDLHFGLEQPARFAEGLFLNFNGTAGIWRRDAIEDAGGWRARTVTEDIDLSYRAQLKGWRISYLDSYACLAELPVEISAVRSQQWRWQKGGAQNARLHLAPIARSGLPLATRWHACQHLLAGSMYCVIATMLLLTVPLAALKNTEISFQYTDYGIPFTSATIMLVGAFLVARRPRGIEGVARFAAEMAAFMVFTMGLATSNGMAAVSGWFRRGGEFVRTPKAGSASAGPNAYTRRSLDSRVGAEALVLGVLLFGIAIGWHRHEYAFVPVQLMGVAGISWVIALSLWQPLRGRLPHPVDETPPVPRAAVAARRAR